MNIPEEELTLLFTEALKPKTRCQLIVSEVKTLQEAIKQAAVLEECYGRETAASDTKRINYVATQFPKRPQAREDSQIKFSRGGRFVQRGANMRTRPSFGTNANGSATSTGLRRPKTDKKVSGKCFNCQKTGHWQKDCWSKPKTKVVNSVVEASVDTLEGLTPNHINNVYMVLSENYGLTEAKGWIGGYGCTLAFDSGATVNILSKKFVDKVGINRFKTMIPVKMADGRVVYPEKTAVLQVEVFNNVVNQEFIVLEGLEEQDALLGKPWFREANAGIFPGSDVLVFRDESKSFNRCKFKNAYCSFLMKTFFKSIKREMSDKK